MSWYSDGERFDEYDPPCCENCHGGIGGCSVEECAKCMKIHEEGKVKDEEMEISID